MLGGGPFPPPGSASSPDPAVLLSLSWGEC
jgi:hypothetical protein